jgi:hypothetical protein
MRCRIPALAGGVQIAGHAIGRQPFREGGVRG